MADVTATETNGIPSEITLLPCWHCGGDAEISYGFDDYGYDGGDRWRFYRARVMCRCGLELKVENDGDEYLPLERALGFAVDAWNTRVAVTDCDFAMAVHDGRTWVCVEGALESDVLKPIEGFTRDSIYRDSMAEYGEWMEKAVELMRDLWSGFECGVAKVCVACSSGAKLGDAPCAIEERLREFGIEVD